MNDREPFDGPLRYPQTRWRRRAVVQREIDGLLDRLRRSAAVGLHLGAGSTRIPGLVNCDAFDPAADLQVDATNLARFESDSVDLIESHHMIEHLSLDEIGRALGEWRRVLRPGGLLVLTCPNLTWICAKWMAHRLRPDTRSNVEASAYVLKMLVGSQEHAGMFHRSGYDGRSLARRLREHGLAVEFSYTPYPSRPTPSLLTIARKR